MWWAYSDLANYLAGQSIGNMEVGISWQPTTLIDGSRQQVWTPSSGSKPTSVRLDFNDSTSMQNPWRGRLTVKVEGPGGIRTAFAQRLGSDSINPYYNSVFVPLPVPANGDMTATRLTITMTRESGSPWPTLQRLVAAQYEPVSIASANFEEPSTASRVVQSGQYADSADTHEGFAVGKLTDGNGNGAMGWNLYDARFSVTLDLGSSQNVTVVSLTTHSDQTKGINWPREVAATAGACPPHARGISGKSCAPLTSSGEATLTSQRTPGSVTSYSGTITLPITGNVQYVTVTGLGSGWALLDVIEVKNNEGAVISTGKSYTVTPKPSVEPVYRLVYGDDSHKLVDGAVSGDFFPPMDVGIPSNEGGNVESTWVSPRAISSVNVWLTRAVPDRGIHIPHIVTIQWRNQDRQWQAGAAVVPQVSCGPAPCAKQALPMGSQVTGVRATFPIQTTTKGWFMVSELSTQ